MKKFVVVIILIGIIFSLLPVSIAFATETSSSDVLADLKKDSTFDPENYPIDLSDNKMTLFQIAESTDQDLLVYVYEPNINKDFRASSINLSTTIDDDVSFKNYPLIYLNSSGTLYKYKVDQFKVSATAAVRYYSISQIMRPFDPEIDEDPGNGNTVSEVPISVSKQFAFYKVNGEVVVDCVDIETVKIDSMFVGFFRYSRGGIFHPSWLPTDTDSHFVAFSTDREIEDLYEVDIQWKQCFIKTIYEKTVTPLVYDWVQVSHKEGTVSISEVKTLKAENVVSQNSNRPFAYKFSFRQIESVEQVLQEDGQSSLFFGGRFIQLGVQNQISDIARRALSQQQWVLRFLETSFYEAKTGDGLFDQKTLSGTRVTDVLILRLKFKSQGQVYNLGTISNKQTGSTNPSNEQSLIAELTEEGKEWLQLALLIVGVILLFTIGAPILKVVIWILSLPINAIKSLANSSRNRKINRALRKSNRK